MKEMVNREELADLWAGILRFTEHPQDLFGPCSDRLFDRQSSDMDRLPHPGFVGPNYAKGGLLFLAMNPGNGPSGADPAQEPHYECLRRLRDAPPQDRRESFDALMTCDESWYPQIRIMNVVVKPVLDGTGCSFDSIAFMNVLKWRTKDSSGLAPLYKISMKAHTLDQLHALDPGIIVLLGVGVSHVLHGIPDFERFYADRCVTIPRTIGDYRLAPQGHAAVKQACERFGAVTGTAAGLSVGKATPIPPPMPAVSSVSIPSSTSLPRPLRPLSYGKPQADLDRDQAKAFRQKKHAEATALNVQLNDYVLGVDRDNDVAVGMKGPRHAIVAFAQKMATKGATYGEVIGKTVTKGDGTPFRISEADLLGYVCANGYCSLTPPAR